MSLRIPTIPEFEMLRRQQKSLFLFLYTYSMTRNVRCSEFSHECNKLIRFHSILVSKLSNDEGSKVNNSQAIIIVHRLLDRWRKTTKHVTVPFLEINEALRSLSPRGRNESCRQTNPLHISKQRSSESYREYNS